MSKKGILFIFFCFFFYSFSAFCVQKASLVADVSSGYILTAENADDIIYPASLTKLMTLYLTFSALDKGLIKWEDTLYISKKAIAQPKSKIYIDTKRPLTVREAVMALIVKSANDVAVVLAENLAPTEHDFSILMTKTAHRLGMQNTVFMNASGLYNRKQISNAKDMAILALALLNHFPQYYPLFKTKFTKVQGKVYGNHNNIIHYYKGSEGLKTGYLYACGYHVISTCTRGKNHLVALSLGQNSVKARDKSVVHLLNAGFKEIKTLKHSNKENPNNPFEKKALLKKPPLDDILHEMKTAYAEKHPNPSKVFLPTKKPHIPVYATSKEENTYWQAQAGAYSSLFTALKKAKDIEALLGGFGSVQILPFKDIYRVRVFDLENRKKAVEVCRLLEKNALPCFVVAPSKD